MSGYTLPADDVGRTGVGIEVRAKSFEPFGLVMQELLSLGAPRETSIEIETGKSMVELSLRELTHPDDPT